MKKSLDKYFEKILISLYLFMIFIIPCVIVFISFLVIMSEGIHGYDNMYKFTLVGFGAFLSFASVCFSWNRAVDDVQIKRQTMLVAENFITVAILFLITSMSNYLVSILSNDLKSPLLKLIFLYIDLNITITIFKYVNMLFYGLIFVEFCNTFIFLYKVLLDVQKHR